MVIEFRHDDEGYKHWLTRNPDGHVVNTYQKPSPRYLVLHRATCRTIITPTANNLDRQPFTGTTYMKACSAESLELLAWAQSHGGSGFSKLCGTCSPVEPMDAAIRHSREQAAEFLRKVDAARMDANSRRQRLKTAPVRPAVIARTSLEFVRNPDVVAEVLERANGVCEVCHLKAPFQRRSDGTPYLEVHHITMLAHGGDDSVENSIAVCPNCHRRLHFGPL